MTKLAAIKELIHPILDDHAVFLDDMEYVKEGQDYFLRIFIDKPGGVDLMDCSQVSEHISDLLDQHNPIKEAYFLEVSSPGVEKPLVSPDDFKRHLNDNIFVSLYVHINGEKEYEGRLIAFEDNIITVEYKWKHTKKQVQIPFDKIAKARLSVML